jgi:hypothetical protein
METLIVSLPLILVAFARVIEASAIVILALRRDRPLRLAGMRAGPGMRLRLTMLLKRRHREPTPVRARGENTFVDPPGRPK